MKNSILACVIVVLTVVPSLADEAKDIAVAEGLLKVTELGAESANAAMDRANAALLAVISRSPDSDVMREFKARLEHCFREDCKSARRWGPEIPSLYRSDEQLESEGYYTRTKANAEGCGELDFLACKEPLPENLVQIARDNYGMLGCIVENSRAKSIRDRLYRLFFDEEVERRLEGVEPTERDAIKSQIGPTDN